MGQLIKIPDDITDLNTLYRGDTFPALAITITNKATGDPVDITDWEWLFQIRKEASRSSQLYYEATLGDGLTLIDASLGQLQIDSFDMDFFGQFYGQLQRTDTDSKVLSFFDSLWTIRNDTANTEV